MAHPWPRNANVKGCTTCRIFPLPSCIICGNMRFSLFNIHFKKIITLNNVNLAEYSFIFTQDLLMQFFNEKKYIHNFITQIHIWCKIYWCGWILVVKRTENYFRVLVGGFPLQIKEVDCERQTDRQTLPVRLCVDRPWCSCVCLLEYQEQKRETPH